MERTPGASLTNGAADLSKAEPFGLGPMAVDPPSRRIGDGARSEMLEPRVMRVLVALSETPGRVLSSDDLIELCWDSQIVSDKAITRATSLLRHALEDMSGGVVRLETIPRVGFRLLPNGAESSGAASGGPLRQAEVQSGWSRSAAVSGLVLAGGAAVTGFAGWFGLKQHVPDPHAIDLYRRGQVIQKVGIYEDMGEAIKLYKRAVAIDPRYADSWAGIAIGMRYPVNGPNSRFSDPQEVRAAAGRALALDPANADAQLALISAYPKYRGWIESETRLRAFLGQHPDSALGNVMLGLLLLGVGRIEEALAAARRAIGLEPMQQVAWSLQVLALTYAGRFPEAELALGQARSRWPQDSRLWIMGNGLLLESRQYAAAIEYLRDVTRRPASIPAAVVERVARQHEALATGQGLASFNNDGRNVSAATLMEQMPYPVTVAVLRGMKDQAFDLLEAYFFGGEINGMHVPPPGSLDERFTVALFMPSMLTLRDDSRYASLLERTGLEDYWRKSVPQPDFRRNT